MGLVPVVLDMHTGGCAPRGGIRLSNWAFLPRMVVITSMVAVAGAGIVASTDTACALDARCARLQGLLTWLCPSACD